jgi:two-component system NtrC family sensor kinase
MVDQYHSPPNDLSSAAPGQISDETEIQRTILERPKFSIRARIVAVFIVLFLLMGGITITAIHLFSDFKVKLQLLEEVGNYTFEVQQARRYEKDYFLYGTNLSDALANIHTAHSHLESGAEELKAAFGEVKYRGMTESLVRYEQLLESLISTNGSGKPEPTPQLRQVETDIRRHGAQMVADAQRMMDQQRLTMYSNLQTSILAAVGFLVFLFFVMAYEAAFITRAVLTPLGRFMNYAARIGEGDYSLITPTRKYRDEFSNLALAFNQMLLELRTRQEQLLQSRKMAAVGTLTSGIAHELNNPLNNIGITTEALIESFDDYSTEKKLNMLRQIYTQVERAGSTVRNLLDFTRKETPAFTPVSPAEILEFTLKLIDNELALNGVEKKIDIKQGLPQVMGNPRNLQQVFLNLILNSIQAMPDGGTIKVSTSVEGDQYVRVDVSDTGVGIPKENLDKIFDPFFTTKDPGLGTGLGLSVSYGIIEKHKGRITVESEVGKGTTFSVLLPVVQANSSEPV